MLEFEIYLTSKGRVNTFFRVQRFNFFELCKCIERKSTKKKEWYPSKGVHTGNNPYETLTSPPRNMTKYETI